jgi:hypothetical protein
VVARLANTLGLELVKAGSGKEHSLQKLRCDGSGHARPGLGV